MGKAWMAAFAIAFSAGGCASAPPVADCGPREAPLPPCVESKVGAASRLSAGSSREFVLDARCEWNRSGVLLDPDGDYRVTARDKGAEKWEDKSTTATPDAGWTDWMRFLDPPARWFARARGIPMYALVASQGADGPVSRATNGAVVHSQVRHGQPLPELLFYANDWPGFYANNHGCLAVTVRRLP